MDPLWKRHFSSSIVLWFCGAKSAGRNPSKGELGLKLLLCKECSRTHFVHLGMAGGPMIKTHGELETHALEPRAGRTGPVCVRSTGWGGRASGCHLIQLLEDKKGNDKHICFHSKCCLQHWGSLFIRKRTCCSSFWYASCHCKVQVKTHSLCEV